MRGILKGIKHLPSRRSDQSTLNSPHNQKLQDYAKLTRSEQGKRVNKKYKSYLDSQNMHHLTKTIFVKLVIDTYENTGPKDNTRTRRHPSSSTVRVCPPSHRNLQNLGYRAKPQSPNSRATTKCKQIIQKNPQTAQGVSLRQERQRRNQVGSRKAVYFGKDHSAVQSVGKKIQ